jgi:hypothetical protein
MNKIKPNPKYLRPINAVILGIMIAISLFVIVGFFNNKTSPVERVRELTFHFDYMKDCSWNGHNIVIEYNDGSDYNKYNTISDSLFTNYICVNVPNHLAERLIEDYKDYLTTDNRVYAIHLEHRWYIEERIIGKQIKFTLKERTK